MLAGHRLLAFPVTFWQLSQLSTLGVFKNRLQTIPAEIGTLQQLGTLYLKENQLTDLPPEIGQLTQLEILGVSCNDLCRLPVELAQLKMLYQLDLSYNSSLETLPDELWSLPDLFLVLIEGNHLTHPPQEIVYEGVEAVREYLKGRA